MVVVLGAGKEVAMAVQETSSSLCLVRVRRRPWLLC
jgi:hypothetical protein